jgi:hypothetical protein
LGFKLHLCECSFSDDLPFVIELGADIFRLVHAPSLSQIRTPPRRNYDSDIRSFSLIWFEMGDFALSALTHS